jgi:UMF1 family MFS transporter
MDNFLAYDRKQSLSWALYDCANSAFALTVMAGFFPIFFKNYWGSSLSSATGTFQIGVVHSVSSFAVVLLAPVLGAIADRGSRRKRFLVIFAFLGALSTMALSLVAQGQWVLASIVYILGAIGFSMANSFYDSLLVSVSSTGKREWVSALGFSLGYLGGGLLFAVNIAMVSRPDFFGISSSDQAIRISFVLVGLWWIGFSVPLFLWVREPGENLIRPGLWEATMEGVHQLRSTLREVSRLRTVSVFLLAYWLYIDGVDTIVRMAVDYGISIGLDQKGVVLALLLTQFVGVPSALFFGKLGEWIGPKAGIFICLGGYIVATLGASFVSTINHFFLLAVLIGLVQGGIQSLSRSYYVRLIPANRVAEFFGFYNMLGKFAAVIGPILIGVLGLLTGNPRISILSVTILFVLGGVLLARVDEKQGYKEALRMERS